MTTLIIPDEMDKRLKALAGKVHLPKDEYALGSHCHRILKQVQDDNTAFKPLS